METLELLAPAKDYNIGIAAIDCGADAVYIAAEHFGARQAAGNSLQDIARLCDYAHRYGAKIFLTLNTILFDSELSAAGELMMAAQDAGVDAIIVQDFAVLELARQLPDFHLPLHASTQCAIRTAEQAEFLESLGFSRLILERQLSLDDIRAIRAAVSCELEFFVHGALCVCYSGNCYLSSCLTGRSANRGECAQPCRSRYDLIDEDSGKVLLHDKALLSLKDYNLKHRLSELAAAGISSFKIEGRLKNESYVKNVVRDYSTALEQLCSGGEYRRSSFGVVSGGFTPDTDKTFNRSYTELFIDGRRGQWAAMDAAKSMGEYIGRIRSVDRRGNFLELTVDTTQSNYSDSIKPDLAKSNGTRPDKGVRLNNGDGFAFIAKDGSVAGFRADVCSGNRIICQAERTASGQPQSWRTISGIKAGLALYRNLNVAFEKELAAKPCKRLLRADIGLNFVCEDAAPQHIPGTNSAASLLPATDTAAVFHWIVEVNAVAEDGRTVHLGFDFDTEQAANTERMEQLLESQLNKTAGSFIFTYRPATGTITIEGPAHNPCAGTSAEVSSAHITGTDNPDSARRTGDGVTALPLLKASDINMIRRSLAEALESIPTNGIPLLNRTKERLGAVKSATATTSPSVFSAKESAATTANTFLPDSSYRSNIANHLAESAYRKAGAAAVEQAYELGGRHGAELMRTKYCIRYELGLCPKYQNGKPPKHLALINNGVRLRLNFDCGHCEMTVSE